MNAPASINLQLLVGSMVPSAAPAYVTEKLESVEVVRSADQASVFHLVFHADRTRGSSPDFALLESPLLKPWNRVLVRVTVASQTVTLIDGFITHQELSHDKAFASSTLTVTGEDVSILMDRVQYSLEYPAMGDSLMVLAVLAKYSMIGIVPEVMPTASDLVTPPIERTPQQNSTDRAFVRQLAQPYGYWFCVQPGPEPLTNVAYWGPPRHIGSVKPALSMDVGPATNVEKISFTLDSIAPIQFLGMVQDDVSEMDLPLGTLASTRLPALATDPAFNPVGLLQRRDIFTDPRFGYVRAMVDVQAQTDVSTDDVVTVEGELDTMRYGAVLDAPGLVDVRGAGQSYDGRYVVRQVTHTLSRGAYRQGFRLSREGTGSTVSRVAS